jgi:hypothetical protein
VTLPFPRVLHLKVHLTGKDNPHRGLALEHFPARAVTVVSRKPFKKNDINDTILLESKFKEGNMSNTDETSTNQVKVRTKE